MNNLAVIDAANPEMEALAIAVAMREARHLDKSAALVTPDRALARRVMAALGRWNLAFDDSGGDALMDTAGRHLRAAGRGSSGERAGAADPAGAAEASAVPAWRRARRVAGRAIETLELALLRGTRPQAGSAGLARDFARFRDELAKLQRSETSSLHHAEPRTQARRPTNSIERRR